MIFGKRKKEKRMMFLVDSTPAPEAKPDMFETFLFVVFDIEKQRGHFIM